MFSQVEQTGKYLLDDSIAVGLGGISLATLFLSAVSCMVVCIDMRHLRLGSTL